MSQPFSEAEAKVERFKIDVRHAELKLRKVEAAMQQTHDEFHHKMTMHRMDREDAKLWLETEQVHLREALSELEHPFTPREE
jgi:hypothetical protein